LTQCPASVCAHAYTRTAHTDCLCVSILYLYFEYHPVKCVTLENGAQDSIVLKSSMQWETQKRLKGTQT